MKHSIIKDRHFRLLSSFYERRRVVFRSIIENKKFEPRTRTVLYEVLSSFPPQAYSTRSRNRCTLTGRSRAIYRKFGRSRLRFRKLASYGVLVGVKKSS